MNSRTVKKKVHVCFVHKTAVPNRQRAQHMSAVKTNRLEVSGETVAFYCEIHVYISNSVWQNAEFVNVTTGGTGQLKCFDTHAETRFRLLAKRMSPFKSAGASVQSTAGSRGVRISFSNVGYIIF
jgi:hypothetical protein